MARKYFINFWICSFPFLLFSQKDFYQNYSFSEADTLRGMLRPERTCFDVFFYELNIEIDPDRKFIKGYTDIHFNTIKDFEWLQIDLYENMKIDKVIHKNHPVAFNRRHNAVFVQLPAHQKGEKGQFRVYYNGHPRKAVNPPWDGGFVWTKDKLGRDWVGVSCEGDGASLWWPNKDHLSDEPDSMSIKIAVPAQLTCIANGNLRKISALENEMTRYDWFVSYPINNYNVTVNIGHYQHFSEIYTAKDTSTMPLDYYVLSYNLEKAKEHFKQVKGVLQCFEYYFGKYPFWNDGFALVETPYLGMEHQGAIAYGNNYMRGYLGGMIPGDMTWDYIIVHETGHEYFGNSVSCKDLCDMWIHESFTTYMEALYVECYAGKEEAIRYLKNFKKLPYIYNREPILGPPDVNWENWMHSDHYFKGSWILHTLRNVIDNDETWFALLKGIHQDYKIKNVSTSEIIEYINQFTSQDFAYFFEQYLEYPDIPRFEYKLKEVDNDLEITFKWNSDVEHFSMPFKVGSAESYITLSPTTAWQTTTLKNVKKSDLTLATELFLVETKRVRK